MKHQLQVKSFSTVLTEDSQLKEDACEMSMKDPSTTLICGKVLTTNITLSIIYATLGMPFKTIQDIDQL